MKNNLLSLTALSLLFLKICTLTSLDRTVNYHERVWSIVKLETNNIKKSKPDDSWVPAIQVEKFLNLIDGIMVNPNFRSKPTTISTQSETGVDVHQSNNNIIFCSANATNYPVTTVYGTGVYWSLSAKTTWTAYDNLPFGRNSGDPASVIGLDGKFYKNFIASGGGQGVAVSTSNDVNRTTYTVVPNPGSFTDKNHYMVDKKSDSPYLNRSYYTWADLGGTNEGQAVLYIQQILFRQGLLQLISQDFSSHSRI